MKRRWTLTFYTLIIFWHGGSSTKTAACFWQNILLAHQSRWQRLCCRLGFGSKKEPQMQQRPQAGQWRSLGRWRKWMRLDWAQLALSQSPVESAGSGCMTLPPGCIRVWGLEDRKWTCIPLKIAIFHMYSEILNKLANCVYVTAHKEHKYS